MSFFCADWALGKHAHNYFAKNLLPHTRHQLDNIQGALESTSAVCLPCWHFRRHAVLEDEFHILCACPEYSNMRQEFLLQSPDGTTLDTHTDMLQAFSGQRLQEAMGNFLHRVRQRRRKLKLLLERYDRQFAVQSYAVRRAAWRFKRRFACRHGVLFSVLPAGGCKCMSINSSGPKTGRMQGTCRVSIAISRLLLQYPSASTGTHASLHFKPRRDDYFGDGFFAVGMRHCRSLSLYSCSWSISLLVQSFFQCALVRGSGSDPVFVEASDLLLSLSEVVVSISSDFAFSGSCSKLCQALPATATPLKQQRD